jgi:glutamine amidotransferase
VKVGIVNYGMGNLASVRKALEDLGAAVVVADRPAALLDCNRLVLPGVGAFGEGMARLHGGGWLPALRAWVADEGRPLLGICLGMQMLATEGTEGGRSAGLGLVEGTIRRLDELGCRLRVPHVGWNALDADVNDPLFAHIPQASDFYFVHSYAFDGAASGTVIARTDYGVQVTAAVRRGNVFGTQFHPEKSSKAGRQLLRNFLDHVPAAPC